jgi:hypothetical protein
MTHLSRREFAALVASGAVAGAAAPFAGDQTSPRGSGVTAQDVIERIRTSIGVEWRSETVDTVKAGDPATAITGIVTTSLASMAVLQQAVKAGANLIVTNQPTFYSRGDARTPPAGRGAGRGAAGAAPLPPPPADAVFTAKNAFITRHNLVVFRLSDHWKLRRPDPFAQGLGATLGWTPHQVTGDVSRYEIPAVSLDALASTVKARLNARGGVRVVGDPQARVQRVAILPGSTPITASLATLPAVDVIVAGEVREWESTEYVRDVVHAGGRKGLILVGRIVSDDAGMQACASWLAPLIPEVRVRHLSAGDPYWRPA